MLFKLIFGFVKIELSGSGVEALLNAAVNEGLILWKITRKNETVRAYIKAQNYKYLRKIRKGKDVKIKILKKYGVPFLVIKHQKRFGFIAGAVIFFVILNLVTNFIWLIDVSGNEKIDKNKIINVCNDLGIFTGVKKSNINTNIDAQRLILNCDGLAWASLNIEGSKLTVNVTELKEKNKDKVPTNIVASDDGLIKKIDVRSGNSVVKVGDIVKKGDVLVSGITENLHTTVFEPSVGEIYAETTIKIAIDENYIKEKTMYTGKIKNKAVLKLFSLHIPLYLGEENSNFNSEINENKLTIFNQELPISITKKTFNFLEKKKIKYSKEELTEILKKKSDKLIEEYGKIEIINDNIKTENTASGIKLYRAIKCNREIGVKKEILLNTEN